MRPLAQTLLTVPYLAIRTPVATIDEKVLGRFAVAAPAHVAAQRGIGALDALAGRLLASDEPAPAPVPVTVTEEEEAIAAALLSEEEQRRHVGELAEADEQTQEELAHLRARHAAEERAEERRLAKASASPKAAPTKAAPSSKAAPTKAAPRKPYRERPRPAPQRRLSDRRPESIPRPRAPGARFVHPSPRE